MSIDKQTFYFFSSRYATRFHIARILKERDWQEVNSPEDAAFSDQNLILDDEVSKHLEYKNLLAGLVQKYAPELMPLTYSIDDDTIQHVLAKLTYDNYIVDGAFQEDRPHLKWILKPALLNNADHILLFNTLKDLKSHFQSAQRLGGPHVIQKYVTNPALIEGHKFTFRLHVIFTNYDGILMMKDGYLNISGYPFSLTDSFANRKAHITNYVLDGEFAHIEQRLASSLPNFKDIYQQMTEIVKKTVLAVVQMAPQYLTQKKVKAFEIFGYDFILDDQGKLWLLEVNQAPDAPTFEENWLNEPFWQPFWHNLVDEFVIPIALGTGPQNHYQFYHHVLKAKDVMSFWHRLKKVLSLRT